MDVLIYVIELGEDMSDVKQVRLFDCAASPAMDSEGGPYFLVRVSHPLPELSYFLHEEYVRGTDCVGVAAEILNYGAIFRLSFKRDALELTIRELDAAHKTIEITLPMDPKILAKGLEFRAYNKSLTSAYTYNEAPYVLKRLCDSGQLGPVSILDRLYERRKNGEAGVGSVYAGVGGPYRAKEKKSMLAIAIGRMVNSLVVQITYQDESLRAIDTPLMFRSSQGFWISSKYAPVLQAVGKDSTVDGLDIRGMDKDRDMLVASLAFNSQEECDAYTRRLVSAMEEFTDYGYKWIDVFQKRNKGVGKIPEFITLNV